MNTIKRRIIIGLDGVPYELLEDLANRGIMPNTKSLISEGIFKKMESSIPEISSVAWSSIITGDNPAQHGVFGFMDFAPNSYRMRFPNYSTLKSSPFWDGLEEKSIIVNVPSTYPVKEMNGVHISGFVSLNLDRSVHPGDLVPKLKDFDYRLDVDSQKAHKSIDMFLNDLDRTLNSRIKTYRYLWDNQRDWDNFMLVFTGTDRLMHFLWDAYEDEQHKYHGDFLDYFRKIDEVIGEIANKLDDGDSLIMLSDHGFEKLDKDVYINYILKEEGFLEFEDEKHSWKNINSRTKAFALDPGRIYINLKNKYPKGSISKENRESIIRELEDIFSSLEVNGEKVIRDTYRKEDIYDGPLLEQSPDLILVGNKGFNLKGTVKATELSGEPIFTGKHTQHNAFLLTKNLNEDIVPNEPKVYDIRSLIESSPKPERSTV